MSKTRDFDQIMPLNENSRVDLGSGKHFTSSGTNSDQVATTAIHFEKFSKFWISIKKWICGLKTVNYPLKKFHPLKHVNSSSRHVGFWMMKKSRAGRPRNYFAQSVNCLVNTVFHSANKVKLLG